MNPKKNILHNTRSGFFSLRKKKQENLKVGYQSTYIILIAIIASLLIYYVWILNSNATQWYSIRELEREQQELKDELNRIESKISEYESINTIENSEVIQDMEQPDELSYLIIKEDIQYVYNY